MNSIIKKATVVCASLLAGVLTSRGDTNDYVREEWTERMGADWPSSAEVVHWHEKEGAGKTGKAWAIKFDMTDACWRFTTRLGLNNTTNTNESRLAKLKQMAGKFEDEGRKPLVAINGNYFDNVNGFINIYGALWSDGRRLVGGAPLLQYDTAREFSLDGGSVIMGKDGWPRDVANRKKIRSGTDFYADPSIRYKDGEYFDSKCGDAVETYPRSLVGVGTNEWGRSFLVMFVSDGRQDDWSHGLTDHDAVSLVVSLGCHVVSENDGGGSAGMWIKGLPAELTPRDEEYINKGCDGSPRAVAAGLFMMYEEPFVERITAQANGCEDPFENFDDAFMMGENGDILWINEDVPVKTSVTNTHNCTVLRGAFASGATAIRVASGAEWTVGAYLTLQDIRFAGTADGDPPPVLRVKGGCKVSVGSGVEGLRLKTASMDDFEITDGLSDNVSVDCASASTNVPAFFGKTSGRFSQGSLDTTLSRLENPNDPSQIAAVEERLGMFYLKWMPGCVRVNGGRRYGTLEDAIAAVAGIGNSTIEIIAPAVLTKSCVIPTNCTITATNENAWAAAVNVAPGATLTVGAGARVLFRNVVFTNAAQSVAVEVAPRGTAAVAGCAELGEVRLLKDIRDGSSNPARGAFELAGPLLCDVRVAGAAGTDIGGLAGSSSLSLEEAKASAGHIVNDEDDELAGEAYVDADGSVKIRWAVAEVADGNALARFISEDGAVTNNYRSLRMLFRELKDGGQVELLAECSLVESATIPAGKTVAMFSAGDNPALVRLPASNTWKTNALISVLGSLSVENVAFDGLRMPSGGTCLSVFRVYRDGSLAFGASAGIQNVVLASSAKGVVYVLGDGTFQMGDGSFVTGCSGGDGGGAAVYLSQASAAFNLLGGRIAGCQHGKGAVYAYAKGSLIAVSGDVNVTGNRNGSGLTCNVTLTGTSNLKLVGALTGTVGITYGNAPGKEFGIVASGGDSADHFLCDVKPDGKTLLGKANGGSLAWDAVVVVPPSNVEVNGATYGTLADAVAAAAAGDTLTILEPIAVSSMPVRIDKPLTITAADPAKVISRGTNGPMRVSSVARAIEIAAPGVVFSNVVLGDDDCEWPRAFVHVLEGGELTLGEGAVIRNVRAKAMMREGRLEPIGRSAAGVLVAGKLVMEDGSAIVGCTNRFDQSAGGGVLVSGPAAVFDFRGGTVTGCSASRGGGVFVEKHATALVQGNGAITNNANGNLYMAAESPLEITDVFTGRIDHMKDIVRSDTETNIFAEVTYDYTADLDALAAGAIRFTNELTRACGVAVTNGTGDARYVWSTALAHGATYEKGGVSWTPVGEVPPVPWWVVEVHHPAPIAFKAIERVSETEWTLVVTDRVEYCNYRLIWTDDLSKGFTTTGGWEHAVGEAAEPTWTTNVITTGGAWFWRAEGADGTNMVPPVANQ